MKKQQLGGCYLNDMNSFDWSKPLTEDEAIARMHRVCGNCECEICGKLYYDHPMETRITDRDGYKFLHQLCNGWLGKL